jgi:AcrR family transcriptional regulator
MIGEESAKRGRPAAVDRPTVLAAAIKVLRDEGPSGLTVRRLAEVIGVSRQVVYTQFGSLGGLIDALYREGFAELRAAASTIDPGLTGIARVVANALEYRTSALERPELYAVMFERPFREHVPSPESRSVAVAAFQPLVDAVASTGREPGEARNLALTLWGAMHGLVHLELQGYFAFEPSSEQRIIDVVNGLVDDVR